MQLKLLDQQMDKPDKISVLQLMISQRAKTTVSMCIQNLQLMISSYDEALAKIKEVISRIDKNVG